MGLAETFLFPAAVKATPAPGAVEPVTVDEVKAQAVIAATETADDALLGALVTAARLHAENILGRALTYSAVELTLDAWPKDGAFILPRPPLLQVDEVALFDQDGAKTVIPLSDFIVDTAAEPGRLIYKSTATFPAVTLADAGGVKVTSHAGYSAAGAAVPANIKHAILMLAAYWFGQREAAGFDARALAAGEVPFSVSALLQAERVSLV